ncbi:MAG: ABC transporter ATP-binding protein [Polyangiales bacterium]
MTSARAPSPLLVIEDISLSFRGVRALDGVGFTVGSGEICAIIGPNGAGKSSLLNVLSGVYRPDHGRVLFRGALLPPARPREVARRGIARTFQNIALFKGMSVLDNVLTGETQRARASALENALRVGRHRAEERAHVERAEHILELLHIGRHRDAVVGKLPYGLQKRVELARALVASPSLLLLDEPMAGMSFAEKEELCAHIVAANQRLGITVLLIEHDMGVVMDLSARVVVLEHGRLIAVGTPAEVQRDPRVLAAYLGAA